ncbi:hypothetical protein CQ10_34850 [Bradyrhizobium valentinum]|nr:hypothetical protein CQ10_34850 [Bradyrhizobium valentinum]
MAWVAVFMLMVMALKLIGIASKRLAEAKSTVNPKSDAGVVHSLTRALLAWREDLLAVRIELLALGAYAFILLVPDQSSDAIRTMFEEPIGWLVLILCVWFGLLLVFQLSLVDMARSRFVILNRRNGGAPTFLRVKTPAYGSREWSLQKPDLDLQQTRLVFAIAIFVPAVTAFAAIAAHAPKWCTILDDAPLPVWPFVALCLLAMFIGCLFAFRRRDKNLVFIFKETSSVALIGVGIMLGAHYLFIRDLPPLLLVIVWTALIVATIGQLETFPLFQSLPVITLAVLVYIELSFFDVNDNHGIRTIAVDSSSPHPQAVREAFDRWLNARNDVIERFSSAGKSYPVFLVVSEGGGLRASVTTALMLEKLRLDCPDALRHTFVTIGVSGGSVGAMLANAAIKRDGLGVGCSGDLDDRTGPVTAATRTASDDLLRPLLFGMLFADIPSQFIGFFGPRLAHLTDRARYLESGVASAWQRYVSGLSWPDLIKSRFFSNSPDLDQLPFRALWRDPSGNIPALMLLATDVNSGRRVAASHLLMPSSTAGEVSACKSVSHPLQEASIRERTRIVSLAELLPDKDVAATTAAVLSARFPGVTPAGTLTCGDAKLRLVDGGYFENSGLTTAIDVVREILPAAVEKKVLINIISIENSEASPDWRFAQGLPPPSASTFLPELFSPLRAMEGSRQAHGDLAQVAMEGLVADSRRTECKERECLSRISFKLRRCKTPIPLGWSLSRAAVGEIRRQLFALDGTEASDGCAKLKRGDEVPRQAFGRLFSLLSVPQ